MLFNFETKELENGFSIITITMNTQIECFINLDDFYDEISETIYKYYNDFECNTCALLNGDFRTFYTVPGFNDDAIKDIEEVINYFNVLNDKIVGLEEPLEEKQEDEELDVEKLELKDYKSMMDAWARNMRDKFAKEANLSKEEISEQIDESTKSFVSNIGILAQKVLYITGSKLYAHRVKIFCNECREKGIFESARSLRKYFSDLAEGYKTRGQQEGIKTAMQLKELFGDEQEQGVFGSIISGFYWIYYKVKNYFKNVIQVNVDDNSIIGKIIEGVGLITNLILTGVKIIFTIVGHVASFVVAVVTKAAVALYDAVKGILQKIKNAVMAFKNRG